MKDFIIDCVVAQTGSSVTVIAQSSGTLSDRPVIKQTLRKASHAEAAFTGVLEALKDLSGFLNEGDHVDAKLHSDQGPVDAWIIKGSGNPTLDGEVRAIMRAYDIKGISVTLVAATAPRADLTQKIVMAHALGM